MLRVFNPKRIISDREWKFVAKNGILTCTSENNPSVFDLPLDELSRYLQENKFRIAVVFSKKVAQKLDNAMFCALNIDEYKFYLFPEDKKLLKTVKSRAEQIPVPWLGR